MGALDLRLHGLIGFPAAILVLGSVTIFGWTNHLRHPGQLSLLPSMEQEMSTSQNEGTEPFRSRANSLPRVNRPIGPGPNRSPVLSITCPFAPWPFHSLELSRRIYVAIHFLSSKFPGHFAPGSESSREQIGQGAIGRFAPGSEWAWERKGCESK